MAASRRACSRRSVPSKDWLTPCTAASGPSFDHPGVFRIGMGTKSVTTVEAIQSLDAQIDDLVKTPPSPEELTRAKDAHPQLVHLQLRHAGKGAAREDGVRVLPLSSRLPRTLSRQHREDDFGRRCTRGAQVRPQGADGRCSSSATLREMGAQKLSLLGKVTPIDISIPGKAAPAARTPSSRGPLRRRAIPKAKRWRQSSCRPSAAKKGCRRQGGRTEVDERAHIRRREKSPIDSDNFVQYPDHVYSQLSTPHGPDDNGGVAGREYMAIRRPGRRDAGRRRRKRR